MSKITAYTALSSPQGDAVLPIVDVHDTTQDPSGTTKQVTAGVLAAGSRAVKLQGWYAALAARHVAPATVLCIGDSTTEGQGSTDPAYTYPARLRDTLRARWPTVGLTGAGGGGRGYLAPQLTSPSPTYSANWVALSQNITLANINGYGINGFSYDLGANSGTTLTYALYGTSATLYYAHRTTGGTFSYAVDGGTPVNVSTSAGANADDGQISVPLGAPGVHSLVITPVSGSPIYFTGVVEFNGDEGKGIQVINGGHYGWTCNQFATYFGPTDSAAVPGTAMAKLQPNLIIIGLGSNDYNTGRSAAQYQTDLSAFITILRAAFTSNSITAPPILLMGRTTPPVSGSPSTWQQFLGVMYATAAADPMIDVLDFTVRMPGNAAGQTWGIYAGGNEFSNTGHSWFANVMTGYLSPA